MIPPCYVITCRASGRTEQARANFAAAGIPARFIEGVHGNTWGLDTRHWAHRDPVRGLAETVQGCRELINLAEAGIPAAEILNGTGNRYDDALWRLFPSGGSHVGYRIGPGHIGLCLSHWMVWQLAWDRGLDEVLICEDDCDFRPDFLRQFATHRAELPVGWQVWYVGALNLPDVDRQPITEHLCRVSSGFPFGTHCYMLRRSALPVLIERCCRAYTHVDSLIAEHALPHLDWYVSYPTLVDQHSANGTWSHAV